MLIVQMLAVYALLYLIATAMRGWRSLSVYALAGAAVILWNFFELRAALNNPDHHDERFLWMQALIWMSALGLLAGVSIKAILLQYPALGRQSRLTLIACG